MVTGGNMLSLAERVRRSAYPLAKLEHRWFADSMVVYTTSSNDVASELDVVETSTSKKL